MSHYSVLRFVPDPVAEEFVNVGVVVVDTEGFGLELTTHWQRVQDFAGKQALACVRDVTREITTTLENAFREGGLHGNEGLIWLERWSANWRGVLQVSVPRAATLPRAELLASMVRHLLHGGLVRNRPLPETLP